MVTYTNPTKTHHMLAATNRSKQWAAQRGYTAGGVIGYVDEPIPAPPPPPPPLPIPPTALSVALSRPQLEREAMRRRLYEPQVPWQTYVHSSMSAHTLQPTGLVLRFGLVRSTVTPVEPSPP